MKKKSQSPPPSQIDLLMDLAKEIQSQKRDKSEVLATFQGAGILNKKGEFTKPYRHLAKVVKKIEHVP
jgi:hypothetical protein